MGTPSLAPPRGVDLDEALDYLDVAHPEREELRASAPTRPDEAEAVRAAAEHVARAMGTPGDEPELPRPPGAYAESPHFWAHVCLALLASTRAFHRERGIGDEISRPTLQVLGRNLQRHRRIYGRAGLDGAEWVVRTFRGVVFHLGRLVYDRTTVGASVARAASVSAHDPALGVHIPPDVALSTAASLESFDQAAGFFARHFPETPVQVAHCHSWLMDPQLADYLAPSARLVRFQRLFRHCPEGDQAGDDSILTWIFETDHPDRWRELTARTSLQQAVLDHLAAGGHWRIGCGWRLLRR